MATALIDLKPNEMWACCWFTSSEEAEAMRDFSERQLRASLTDKGFDKNIRFQEPYEDEGKWTLVAVGEQS